MFMKKLKHLFKKRPNARGQSLVELALVLTVLLFMVVAIIEYGFMLNQYLVVMDATRNAARQGSLANPFLEAPNQDQLDPNFYIRPDRTQPVSLTNPPGIADLVEEGLLPMELDCASGDDIVISFYSVTGNDAVLFPYAGGWSWSDGHCPDINHVSQFSAANIGALLNSSAPATGVLLVEVYYNYHQILHLPIFSNVIPDPIPLYTYAIMPLSAAEPTPTPIGP
jgi:hypothetical protein